MRGPEPRPPAPCSAGGPGPLEDIELDAAGRPRTRRAVDATARRILLDRGYQAAARRFGLVTDVRDDVRYLRRLLKH